MNEIHMIPDVLREYAGLAAEKAARITAAGTIDQSANIAAAVPVFGLIGQEFLAAFVPAQASHISSVLGLAEVHAATAAAAARAADAYEATERQSAAAIAAIVP
ncbi:type VII secretion target [Nocardia sp. NPDC127526]|uniref:type VII secretion target n=1 Tax=Nocardia sp. NPDC127526 TaxID=3345393 RepID=UPI0036363357